MISDICKMTIAVIGFNFKLEIALLYEMQLSVLYLLFVEVVIYAFSLPRELLHKAHPQDYQL